MVDAFSEVVDEPLRSRVKEIYAYRNWIAHGKNQNKQPSFKTDPKTVQKNLVDFISQANQALQDSQNPNS